MFTKFICQNDFRPLSTFIRGAVASRLKRLSREQEIPPWFKSGQRLIWKLGL